MLTYTLICCLIIIGKKKESVSGGIGLRHVWYVASDSIIIFVLGSENSSFLQ